MPFSYRMSDRSVSQARDDIDRAIAGAQLPDWVSTAWRGEELEVTLRKGGKSAFRMALRPDGDGVRVVETGRDVSMLHRPFVGQVSAIVEKALRAAGFTAD